MIRRLFEQVCGGIRYEEGRWPLHRWDKNLRYVAKSLLHLPEPESASDKAHFAAVERYLREGRGARGREIAFRMAAAGDLMWIRAGYERLLSPELRARLGEADIAFFNLETPIDRQRPVPRLVYETFHYNAPPAYLEAFEGTARTRVFSLCNNHALDQGPEGLSRTRTEVLRDPQNFCVGGPEAEHVLANADVGGVRVACFGLSYDINHLEGPAPAGIPLFRLGQSRSRPDWERLFALVDAARATSPDLVVLLAHWGFEYEYFPTEAQRRDAYRLIERGVDVILGSSPHVLQPLELVSINGADASCPTQLRREGPARMGVIAYSLGNFASIMPTLPCRTGALLEIEWSRSRDGVLWPASISMTPTSTGRGVGHSAEGSWLDAGVSTLDEIAPSKARAAWAHAEKILGPLVQRARER